MTRRTPQGRAVEVIDRQIPDWVRAVTPPAGPPLATVLTQARTQPAWLEQKPWAEWFDRLGKAALARLGEPPYWDDRLVEFVRLLDLVPGYLHFPERYPWVLSGVRGMFTYRRYTEVMRARRELGKLASDQNMAINFMYHNAIKQGLAPEKVLEELHALYPELTRAALRNAIKRAARSGFAPPTPGQSPVRGS